MHRIGRTGRAGASGRAVSFCADPDERDLLVDIERLIKQRLAVGGGGEPVVASPGGGQASPTVQGSNGQGGNGGNGGQSSQGGQGGNGNSSRRPRRYRGTRARTY